MPNICMCIHEVKGKTGLKIFVQPRAAKTKIVGLYDDMVKLAVAAPPVDGKANKEVISFFARLFQIKKTKLIIASGIHSRRKMLVSDLFDRDMLRQKLSEYIDGNPE